MHTHPEGRMDAFTFVAAMALGALGGFIAAVTLQRANERRTDRPVRDIDRQLDDYDRARRERVARARENMREAQRRIVDPAMRDLGIGA